MPKIACNESINKISANATGDMPVTSGFSATTRSFRSILLILALLAGGCSVPKPVANIAYGKVEKVQRRYLVSLSSDLNIEDLYTTDQKIVAKKLVCALGSDQNFDIKHTMQYVFRGDLKLVGESLIGDKKSSHYISHGDFLENMSGGARRYLDEKDLVKAFAGRKAVACMVVMTVYLSSPYYSGTMYIPTQDILKVSGDSE